MEKYSQAYAGKLSELDNDLAFLVERHGIDDEFISSLTSSPEHATSHVKFYTRMVCVTNGITLMIAVAVSLFGIGQLLKDNELAGVIVLFIGLLLLLLFLRTLVNQVAAVRAVRQVAKKHGLFQD